MLLLSIRSALKFAIPAIVLLVLTLWCQADETAPSPCGLSFIVSGEIHHFKKPADVVIRGKASPEVYQDEIDGKSITATVSGLPAGKYIVEVDLDEMTHHGKGMRVMDIRSGKQTLASNLDIFSAVGFASGLRITGTVDHADEAAGGPLTIEFSASRGEAKFNAIEVRDAATGKPVACVQAFRLATLDPRANRVPVVSEPPVYGDPAQPIATRVDDLARRMSLAEKIGQIMNSAPAIPRLSVPKYDYWNECLHGVARAGVATVFPQAIGMAATWNPELIHQVADVISTEARAKTNRAAASGVYEQYYGLTFWTPNINIFRDPRWGRGQETYGEDPLLTSRMGVALIRGLQGDDPRYYKVIACAKHFAAHSGPEAERHSFDSTPPLRDLYDTYLPQFEAAVKEGRVGCVMASYNALYGVPDPCNTFLLNDILRNDWAFKGYVVSDCGAVNDIWTFHHYAKSAAEGTALAVKAGCDLECGDSYHNLIAALNQGLVSEADIDTAVKRVLTGRFKLGMFDPPGSCPYTKIPFSENDSPAHAKLNLEVARQSLVLLKNNGVLPLDKSKLKSVAVIGPLADSKSVLAGNYSGEPSHPVSILDGIRAALEPDVHVSHSQDIKAAGSADVIIFAGGIDEQVEGECQDRTTIEMPSAQTEMLKALQATGKPVILLDCGGSAVAMPWEAEHLAAILQVWYPGGVGGTAVADILLGKESPSGKLPVTFYRSTGDLPPFTDYSMKERTYRYFTKPVLFPFGHGLSYTTFQYDGLRLSSGQLPSGGELTISLNVKNTGKVAGDEVVQLYVHQQDGDPSRPVKRLAGFQRVHLNPGETKSVSFVLKDTLLSSYSLEKKSMVVQPGKFDVLVGSSSADIRATAIFEAL